MRKKSGIPVKDWKIKSKNYENANRITSMKVTDFMAQSETGDSLNVHENHFLLDKDVDVLVIEWDADEPYYMRDQGYFEKVPTHCEAIVDTIINCGGGNFLIISNEGKFKHLLQWNLDKLLLVCPR